MLVVNILLLIVNVFYPLFILHIVEICLFQTVEYRLADSSNKDKTDGRLEMSFDGDWGTVCKKGFDHKAATAACKSLGMR